MVKLSPSLPFGRMIGRLWEDDDDDDGEEGEEEKREKREMKRSSRGRGRRAKAMRMVCETKIYEVSTVLLAWLGWSIDGRTDGRTDGGT